MTAITTVITHVEKRERPQILVDKAGAPVALSNGVVPASSIATPSPFTKEKCGGKFILHVSEGPGYGLHVFTILPPQQKLNWPPFLF